MPAAAAQNPMFGVLLDPRIFRSTPEQRQAHQILVNQPAGDAQIDALAKDFTDRLALHRHVLAQLTAAVMKERPGVGFRLDGAQRAELNAEAAAILEGAYAFVLDREAATITQEAALATLAQQDEMLIQAQQDSDERYAESLRSTDVSLPRRAAFDALGNPVPDAEGSPSLEIVP